MDMGERVPHEEAPRFVVSGKLDSVSTASTLMHEFPCVENLMVVFFLSYYHVLQLPSTVLLI
jgi:hypothetical protein